jgi:hypothetical protein
MSQLVKESLFVLEHAYLQPLRRMLKRRAREMKRDPNDQPVKPTKLQREKFAADMVAIYGNTLEYWLAEYDRGIENRKKWDSEQ